jgi:hypothetical protein
VCERNRWPKQKPKTKKTLRTSLTALDKEQVFRNRRTLERPSDKLWLEQTRTTVTGFVCPSIALPFTPTTETCEAATLRDTALTKINS